MDESIQTQHVGKIPNNDGLIGIELVDGNGGQCVDTYSTRQEAALLILVQRLRQRYNVPLENVKRHKDFPHSDEHDDPFKWTPAQWDTFRSKLSPRPTMIFAGGFSGSTTTLPQFCIWRVTNSGSITATISGSGTTSDPYTGTAHVVGSSVSVLISGPAECQASATTPFDLTLPISGSSGSVEVHVSDGDGRVDFTGTISGTALAGTLTINAGAFARPIVTQVILTRQ